MSGGPGVAALGVALCLLAAAFGASSLYLPGIALVLIAAGAEASVRLAAWRADVSRDPLAASVEEGASLRLTVRAQRGRLPLGGEVSSLPGVAFRPLARISKGALELTARIERRGIHVLAPSELRFRDPMGICERSLLSPTTEVLVLPRVERIRSQQLARIAGLGRDARRRSRGSAAAEVEGLRPYRPGAPASRIHWPTVARTGTLLERRLQSESDGLPLVVLDLRRPAGIEAIDAGVRAAASLCVGLAAREGCALLLPGEKRSHRLGPDLGAWPALHARLALVQPGGPPGWSALERAATVLWVTVSTRPDPAIARRTGAVHYFVSPFPVAGRAVLFEVAGCCVQAAGRAAARPAASAA